MILVPISFNLQSSPGCRTTATSIKLEVFGPVLVLREFEGEEEAISRANDSECKCSRAHVAGREADSCSSRWPLRQCLHQRYQQSLARSKDSRSWINRRECCLSIWCLRIAIWWIQSFRHRATEGIQGGRGLDTGEDSIRTTQLVNSDGLCLNYVDIL